MAPKFTAEQSRSAHAVVYAARDFWAARAKLFAAEALEHQAHVTMMQAEQQLNFRMRDFDRADGWDRDVVEEQNKLDAATSATQSALGFLARVEKAIQGGTRGIERLAWAWYTREGQDEAEEARESFFAGRDEEARYGSGD